MVVEIILKQLITINGDPVSVDQQLQLPSTEKSNRKDDIKNEQQSDESKENDDKNANPEEENVKTFANNVILNSLTKCVKINDQEASNESIQLKVC